MRYPGVALVLAVAYAVGSQAVGPGRPAGSSRDRRSLLTDLVDHVSGAFGKMHGQQQQQQLVPAAVGAIDAVGVAGAAAKPKADDGDALTVAMMETGEYVRSDLTELVREIDHHSRNKTFCKIIRRFAHESHAIKNLQRDAEIIENYLLSHVYYPMTSNDVRWDYKIMNENHKSRREKLKKLFEYLPETDPVTVAGKLLRLMHLRAAVKQRKKNLVEFVKKNFRGSQLRNVNGALEVRLESEYNRYPRRR